MDQPRKIGFSLARISTEQFATIEEGFNEEGDKKIHSNLRFAADENTKQVVVFSSFRLESAKKPFLIIEGGCYFNIEENAWHKMYDAGERTLTIPMGFITHLSMLTVGTTRGILHAKTEGTCFNKYPIPTINLANMIKSEVTFDFNIE